MLEDGLLVELPVALPALSHPQPEDDGSEVARAAREAHAARGEDHEEHLVAVGREAATCLWKYRAPPETVSVTPRASRRTPSSPTGGATATGSRRRCPDWA